MATSRRSSPGPPRDARIAAAAAAVAALAATGPVAAQTPSPIVPPTRPDQTPPAPVARPPAEPLRPAPSLPDIPPFELRAVDVEGSSLPPAAHAAAWRPFLGRTVGSAELAQIVQAIVDRYEQTDVALYTVVAPAQDFADGRLRIRILEGYIQGVDVEGANSAAREAVRQHLQPLVGVRPLRKPRLQRQVSLARDLPGLRVEVRFAPGEADGAVRLVADVTARPLQLGLSVNNRGAAFLGRTQIAADLYLNQLAPGGQTRLTYVTPTDTERFRYIGLTQSQTLAPSGAVVQLNLGHLRTQPRGSDLTGEASSAGLQLTYPLQRSFTEDLYISVGLDGLNANSAFVGNTFSDDRTRAVRLSVLYGRQDEASRITVSGAGSLGFDALGARTLSPDVTDISFAKLNGRVTWARQLAPRTILRLAAIGQWSADRLPAAEQFAFGGSDFGRGFESAAIIGDKGYAGSAELAFRPDAPPIADFEVFGFVDRGAVVQRRRAGLPRMSTDLSSSGLGFRGSVRERLAFQVEATTALDGSAPGLERDDRVVFSIRTIW